MKRETLFSLLLALVALALAALALGVSFIGLFPISGGAENIARGEHATIGGGCDNTASGISATVPGGEHNTARGDWSFAAGRRAQANHQGAFVWADSADADFASTARDQFAVRANGGALFNVGDAALRVAGDTEIAGVLYVSTIGTRSSRERKENFAPVDVQELLLRLVEIPVTTWNYRSQNPAIRHIGPMAEDFNVLIDGLGGEGEEYINMLDANGVALAAIQGLHELSQEQAARIEALEVENAALRSQMDDLEARLAALERVLWGGGR
ncbi:MAG: hypothetical protein JSV36_09085 [Anaerolineae bacterium]|nr:MAG: hypothetical protein JSV36_09085 [Anaerolineae bacterium]